MSGLFTFLSWASSSSYLSYARFIRLSVSSVEPELLSWMNWANGLSFSCRLGGRLCCSKKKKTEPRVISGRTKRRVLFFLPPMQGEETNIGYFNRMKLKRCQGRRPYRTLQGSWEQIKGLWRDNSEIVLLRCSHHFHHETGCRCHSICHRYSFYSLNAEKFDWVYWKMNKWPHTLIHSGTLCIQRRVTKFPCFTALFSELYSESALSFSFLALFFFAVQLALVSGDNHPHLVSERLFFAKNKAFPYLRRALAHPRRALAIHWDTAATCPVVIFVVVAAKQRSPKISVACVRG